jgi:hypothetical protein
MDVKELDLRIIPVLISLVPNNWWMDKENVVYIHNGVLPSHKEEWNYAISRKMDGTGGHYIE